MLTFSNLMIIANVLFSSVFALEEIQSVSGLNLMQEQPKFHEESRRLNPKQLHFHKVETYKSNVSEKLFDDPQKHFQCTKTFSSEKMSQEVTLFCLLILPSNLDLEFNYIYD